jgi:hypothetical protein
MMTKTEMTDRLARLGRYIQSRIDASPVYPRHLADLLNTVQLAKEGKPSALLAAKAIEDQITASSEGRAALDAA